ncbi:hypothetical protein CTI12_AA543450 [Artemisia annua]|uniref:Reverse transcriptase zinc-binding domain-containing protein n=1 Tax=Artemisia annua TaxID=35608 RepID=A0A2U1L0P0_ARTAN|nr:hypothetical protein CTI12_AA543450 [Artemisia annua]
MLSGPSFHVPSWARFLWNDKVPSKVQGFHWLAIQGRISVKEVLNSRGIIPSGQQVNCIWCNDATESVHHLLLHCGWSFRIWSALFRWWNVEWIIPSRPRQVLGGLESGDGNQCQKVLVPHRSVYDLGNVHSHNIKISNTKNLVCKMSIQIAQIGAGNMKPSYEGSIGREIEKMNVETLVLGSRNCDIDHELEKVEVAHKMFDEMSKVNFGVGHKVFDEMPKGNANPVRADYVDGISGRCAQVCDGHMLALKRLTQDTLSFTASIRVST